MFYPYEEVVIFINTERNFLRASLSIDKILFPPWKSFLLIKAIDIHLGLIFKIVQFKTCNKREIVSHPSYLKLGILSTFSGMGPEKRLFSIFLLKHKIFRKQEKDSTHQAELWDFPKLSIKMNLIAIWKLNEEIVEASTSLSVEGLVEHQGSPTADCSANACKLKIISTRMKISSSHWTRATKYSQGGQCQ